MESRDPVQQALGSAKESLSATRGYLRASKKNEAIALTSIEAAQSALTRAADLLRRRLEQDTDA